MNAITVFGFNDFRVIFKAEGLEITAVDRQLSKLLSSCEGKGIISFVLWKNWKFVNLTDCEMQVLN